MKKLVTTLCTLVCTLCLFSLFAACEDTDKQTTLSYDLTDETCTSDALIPALLAVLHAAASFYAAFSGALPSFFIFR